MCTLGRLIQSMVFSFPSSWILDFGVSSRSQSHELQKLKMASLDKRPCFALNGQNNLWGCFTKRKRMFWSVKASGAQFQPTFCWFSSTNEHKNITDWWMLVLYPASEVVNSVISSSFISVFKEYTRLSPVEILWLKTPCLQISSSKMAPLPLEFWKAVLGMVRIFSWIAQFNSKCK